MAWEYLDYKDYRYKYVGDLLGELQGDTILDFNSGNSRLKNYLKGFFVYKCNDLYDKRADYRITDSEFLEQEQQCDVLCCFGIGGYEITKEELESKTITMTLMKAVTKYKPKYVVLESINRFVELTSIPMKDNNYYECLPLFLVSGNSWLDNRTLKVYKRKNNGLL